MIIADFGQGTIIYKNIEECLAGKDIGILVNNVGVAYDGLNYFHEDSKENMWNMINVNICSMTIMTKMVLPGMLRKKRGAIINMSSVIAMGPQPFMTMYSATKAYVLLHSTLFRRAYILSGSDFNEFLGFFLRLQFFS